MPLHSAGLLLYRRSGDAVEVLLGHLGGPFFAAKDDGAWSIPKGLLEPNEEPFAAAVREFAEELGSPAPAVDTAIDLGTIRQKNGKLVTAWAIESDFAADAIVSNTFELVWPPHSGRRQTFPEIDRAAWFDVATARRKMTAGQDVLLDRLLEHVL